MQPNSNWFCNFFDRCESVILLFKAVTIFNSFYLFTFLVSWQMQKRIWNMFWCAYLKVCSCIVMPTYFTRKTSKDCSQSLQCFFSFHFSISWWNWTVILRGSYIYNSPKVLLTHNVFIEQSSFVLIAENDPERRKQWERDFKIERGNQHFISMVSINKAFLLLKQNMIACKDLLISLLW